MSFSAPLLSTQDLGKSFGGEPLFEGISLSVAEGERLALIGPNGSGKSTLLRMLAGLEEPDCGAVRPRRDLHVVYVAQEDSFDEKLTVHDIVIRPLLERGESEHEVGGKVSAALGRAGFLDHHAPVASLSGGWKKRLAITRALASEPDLLLLDEPTNHLDIDGILWLEDLLLRAPFSLVFVSHDRYFIQRLARRVVEIHSGYPRGFFSATGGYGEFQTARDLYIESLRSAQSSLATKVRREIAWLRQGAKARTTKSKHRIAEAGRMIEELKGMDLDEERARLEFSASERRTRELIKTEGAAASAGGTRLFEKVSLTISPGTRLGVVGPNGSGKTTFVKMLLGAHQPDAGRVVHAAKLRYSFFDQARRSLDRTVTLHKALCPDGDAVVFNGRSIHVVSWAERFLFRPDQLKLPVERLSGGEQARALLARVMLEESDVLVFDEPTNDLDISTLEVLEESFSDFPGAIVLVTHDRYFLESVATSVFGLSGGEGRVFGDYSQWESWHRAKQSARSAPTPKESGSKEKPRKAGKLSYNDQRELEGIESKILKAEKDVTALEEQISSGSLGADPAKLTETCRLLSEKQEQVRALYDRWDELETLKKSLAGRDA